MQLYLETLVCILQPLFSKQTLIYTIHHLSVQDCIPSSIAANCLCDQFKNICNLEKVHPHNVRALVCKDGERIDGHCHQNSAGTLVLLFSWYQKIGNNSLEYHFPDLKSYYIYRFFEIDTDENFQHYVYCIQNFTCIPTVYCMYYTVQAYRYFGQWYA